MSGIAGSEVILLIIIGLIVLGPKRLPQVANQIGSWLGQARRMTRMMRRQLEQEVNFDINKDLGLGLDTGAKSTASVAKPTYVHDRDKNRDKKSGAETPVGTDESEPEIPDDYSPAHGAGEVGTGVGDDADPADNSPEHVVDSASDDTRPDNNDTSGDDAIDNETAELDRKETA